jgi:hypothetical protein
LIFDCARRSTEEHILKNLPAEIIQTLKKKLENILATKAKGGIKSYIELTPLKNN